MTAPDAPTSHAALTDLLARVRQELRDLRAVIEMAAHENRIGKLHPSMALARIVKAAGVQNDG